MNHMRGNILAFAAWLHHTPISVAFQNQVVWLWPACQVLHFIGLGLLFGAVGMFDLRLMGLMKRVPIRAVQEFLPWGILGFGINLTTGIFFVISQPAQYLGNPIWWVKVAFLVIAGLNALVYKTVFDGRVADLALEQDTPTSFKVIGALSLVSWLGVLWAGRMLAFLGGGVGYSG
jgi:hypothetical protein